MELDQIKITRNHHLESTRHFYLLEWSRGQAPVVTASEFGTRIGADPAVVAELTAQAEQVSAAVAATCKTPADQIQIEFDANTRRVRGGYWTGSQQGGCFQGFKDSTIEKLAAAVRAL
jgi:hypothetical protein